MGRPLLRLMMMSALSLCVSFMLLHLLLLSPVVAQNTSNKVFLVPQVDLSSGRDMLSISSVSLCAAATFLSRACRQNLSCI
jgi:hypothetical protein